MLVDLSVTLDSRTPNYPGDPPFVLEKVQDLESSTFSLHSIHMGSHAGTHIDAPSHMLSGGQNIDEVVVEVFSGNAMCIDAVEEGFSLSRLENEDISVGDIIIFNTGTYKKYYEPSYFSDYPTMDTVVAEYLVGCGVKMIGLDTCSADNSKDFPVHKVFLKKNIPIIENLTNLDALTGKMFKIYAFPLRLSADGSPARVIAEIT